MELRNWASKWSNYPIVTFQTSTWPYKPLTFANTSDHVIMFVHLLHILRWEEKRFISAPGSSFDFMCVTLGAKDSYFPSSHSFWPWRMSFHRKTTDLHGQICRPQKNTHTHTSWIDQCLWVCFFIGHPFSNLGLNWSNIFKIFQKITCHYRQAYFLGRSWTIRSARFCRRRLCRSPRLAFAFLGFSRAVGALGEGKRWFVKGVKIIQKPIEIT